MSTDWLGLGAACLGLLTSTFMVARLQTHLGSGDYDAKDPRTVRFFGVTGIVLTLPIVAFTLFQLLSE